MNRLIVKFGLLCALMVSFKTMHAQIIIGNFGVQYVAAPPFGNCSSYAPIQVVVGSGLIYSCQSGIWAQVGGSGSGGGFPIILGSTSIASGSHTTSITGLTVNGVMLNSSGSTSLFLNQAGQYVSAGGGSGSVLSGTQALISGYQTTGTTVGPALVSLNYVAPVFQGASNSDLFQTGGGNNGVANAITAGQKNTFIPSNSTSTEYPTGFVPNSLSPLAGTAGTLVHDYRLGSDYAVYSNPCSYGALTFNNTDCTAKSELIYYNKPPVGNPAFPSYFAHDTSNSLMAYGNNTFPQSGEPAFKTNYGLEGWTINCYTPGQCNSGGIVGNDYHFGDFILGWQNRDTSITGGCGDNGDECKHIAGDSLAEGNNVSTLVCATGCTTGSTLISATPQFGINFGDLAYLFDSNALISSTISGCSLLTGESQNNPAPSVQLSGSNCLPVSTMMLTTAGCQNNANYPVGACGPTVVTLATSGLPTGFTSSLAGLSASGTAYLVDDFGGGTNQWDNEATTYTISGGQLTLNLTQPHVGPFIISIGGAAGGLFFADANATNTINNRVYQGVPILGVIGTTNPTVYFTDKAATVPVLDSANHNPTESAVYQISSTTTSVVSNGTTVTVNFTSPSTIPTSAPVQTYQGQTATLAGLTPSSLNGLCTNAQMTSQFSFTCSKTSAATTATGQGTAVAGSLGYQWTNAVQVEHVMNLTTGNIDGTAMTLFPNNNFAFTTGQILEAVHHPHMQISGNAGFVAVGQYQPSPNNFGGFGGGGLGVTAVDNPGPHLSGLQVDFSQVSSPSIYLGYGVNCPVKSANTCGTKELPLSAYSAFGYYQRAFDVQAGENAVFRIHANNHGTGLYNSPFNLFELDANGGSANVTYIPNGSTLAFHFFNGTQNVFMGGIPFTSSGAVSFTDTDFLTAQTITGIYGGLGGDTSLHVDVADASGLIKFEQHGTLSATASSTVWTLPGIVDSALTPGASPLCANGSGGAFVNTGCSIPITFSFTTTGATTDVVTVTGMTSSGHCAALGPTNAAAGTMIQNATPVYVDTFATNSITVHHVATAGATFNGICTPN